MPKYKKKITVIDLFSGLGGFSQAFLDKGHNVIRIDNNPKFKEIPNTMIIDVLDLTPEDLIDFSWDVPDVVLASIDCTYFTYANNNPDKDGLRLSKELTKHTLKIIHDTKPKYWIIENPPGRIKIILGPPVYKTAWGYWGTPYLKPTWLWGRFPYMEWRTRYTEPQPKETWNLETFKTHKFAYLAPRDSEQRSLVPYTFSKALCIAIEKELR